MKCYCSHDANQHLVSVAKYTTYNSCTVDGCWCSRFQRNIFVRSAKSQAKLDLQQSQIVNASDCYCFRAPAIDCPQPLHAENARKARE